MAKDPTADRGIPGFDAASLTRLVPGFDFLQSLARGAGAGTATPGLAGFGSIGQWVAPTLDPQELERKIAELRTVQFWLEQNATLLKTTIQALEVQKMTLATLSSMKVPLAELRESLKAKLPSSKPETEQAKASPLVDPMQWWNALAGQFTELAAKSLKEGAPAGPTPDAADAPQPPASRKRAARRRGG